MRGAWNDIGETRCGISTDQPAELPRPAEAGSLGTRRSPLTGWRSAERWAGTAGIRVVTDELRHATRHGNILRYYAA
jgi:hypothetical protein